MSSPSALIPEGMVSKCVWIWLNNSDSIQQDIRLRSRTVYLPESYLFWRVVLSCSL